MYMLILYILLPLFVSASVLSNNKKIIYTFSAISAIVLSAVSLYLLSIDAVVQFSINSTLHYIIISLDTLLLLYFAYIGFKFKSLKVLCLALIQLFLFTYGETFLENEIFSDFYADKLSFFMLLVINLVGSIIAIYALKYIEYEDCSQKKKNLFSFLFMVFYFYYEYGSYLK